MTRLRTLTALLATLLALTLLPACSEDGPTPAQVAETVAAAIAKGDVAGVLGEPGQADLKAIVAGMDAIKPAVSVGKVSRDGGSASVELNYAWPLPSGEWKYVATLPLTRGSSTWTAAWSPTLIHPQLSPTTRLVHQNKPAERADITGPNGELLMTKRPVVRLGIDKPKVAAAQQPASARALATLLKINADDYVKRVSQAGSQAFVEALVIRGYVKDVPAGFAQIKGAWAIQDTAVLAPTRAFARPLLGFVGPATDEQAAASKGAILPDDPIGQGGLQARYDTQLRGTAGGIVSLAQRTATATASPSPSPATTPTPSSAPRVTLYQAEPKLGTALPLTLDQSLQTKAEGVLANTTPASAIVAIDVATGQIKAVANGLGTDGRNDATLGNYAPGSTFKIVTTLALLRSGLTPDTRVDCPANITVDGRTFKNYSDFPASRVGSLSLREAVALSCNTALIGQYAKLSGDKVREAANSLGLGLAGDLGFNRFAGSIPDPKNVVGLAESLIGQGEVEASPLGMAAVAASVAAGKTVVPRLIVTSDLPAPSAKPLTQAEAGQLRDVMGAVVSQGTASALRGLAQGAKSGTAEYASPTGLRTRAWMIAYTGSLAVCVFVADGAGGSSTAGPLMAKFLR